MSADSAATAGRALATSLMVDQCTVDRVTGHAVNTQSGAVTDTTSPVYDGPCRVRPNATSAGESPAGERVIVMRSYVVTVPMVEAGVNVGDRVTVTACQLDAALVGVVLRVRDVTKGSHITARRLVCEEQET